MVTVSQNVVVVASTVAFSLLGLAVLNHLWPWQKRQKYNGLITWQGSILGTTYAVMLGFMLYTVWTEYGEANRNVCEEASAVVNLYRLSYGLPDPQRTELQRLARAYTDSVITQGRTRMVRGEATEQTTALSTEMWETVMSIKAASPTESSAQGHVMTELETIAQHRLIRNLQSRDRLPGLLWAVLLASGVLTIVSLCMFATENLKLQAFQVLCLSFLVSLSLVAIADIHRPFYGLIHVGDSSFQRVQHTMQAPY